MIILSTFENPIQAHLLKSRLKVEGIPAFVFDENIVTLNRFYSQAVGGVKVMVSRSDEARARQLIEAWERLPMTNEDGQERKCPRCGSTRLYAGFRSIKSWGGVLAFSLSLFFGVYPFHFRSVSRCLKCGNEFSRQ